MRQLFFAIFKFLLENNTAHNTAHSKFFDLKEITKKAKFRSSSKLPDIRYYNGHKVGNSLGYNNSKLA